MIIIGFFLSLGSFAFGQFSIPVPEKLVYDELNKSQITLIDYKLGLMSYIKPEHSYHPTLGAFCVLENKIAQKTNFPVKMRLGSVDYVDKLEKKRN